MTIQHIRATIAHGIDPPFINAILVCAALWFAVVEHCVSITSSTGVTANDGLNADSQQRPEFIV
jgi:hypothetical protein